jgi:hypothetical protein
MHRKLTLRLDEALIHKMKRISKKSGKSVSRMVADYFSLSSGMNSTLTERRSIPASALCTELWLTQRYPKTTTPRVPGPVSSGPRGPCRTAYWG